MAPFWSGVRSARVSPVADIFVSYTSSDREWAMWIASQLTALGHVPRVHEWEIARSADIYAWMEARHDAADHVLCVISDEYLHAPYSILERNAAAWQAARNRPGFILLVVVKPCRLPTLSDHFRRCELFGVPEDVARLRFSEFIAKREIPSPGTFPGTVVAVSNVPIRVPEHFMGREDTLGEIHRALQHYEGRVAITALHGMRGVGKTTLAVAYAEIHRGDYRATWWIRAQSEPGMRADLVALGVRLRWVAADEKDEPALAVVMERLRHEGDGILLIYDNAVDANSLKPFLPRGGAAQVLVTSNAHAWRGVAEPIQIHLWPAHVGADYLIARTGRGGERSAAKNLSETLGGLPLAHEQAAAYCERLEVPLAEYRRRFDAAPARLLDAERYAPTEYHDRLTVAKTFSLAIDEAAKVHPGAEKLVLHAALLSSEPIPLFLFAEARAKFGEPFASALNDDGLDEAIAVLRAFALLDREMIVDERDPTIAIDTLRLHRLVRQVALIRCTEEEKDAILRALLQAMEAVYTHNVKDPNTWSRARRLHNLALGLIDGDVPLPAGSEVSANHLTYHVAEFTELALADRTKARFFYDRLEGRQGDGSWTCIDEPKIPHVVYSERSANLRVSKAPCVSKLVSVLLKGGANNLPAPFFAHALALCESEPGIGRAEIVQSLASFATLLVLMGSITKTGEKNLTSENRVYVNIAREVLEGTLAISENTLGIEHTDTAWCQRDLARVLARENNLAAARPLFERAVATFEKALGDEHLDTLQCLDELARVLHDQGDLAAAQRLQERLLQIREKILGPDHPETAQSLHNLADVLHKLSDLSTARLLTERALAIRERILGPDHPHTARTVNNLAALLRDQGDLAAARALFERAVAIDEKALGTDHPDTATTLSNLAALLHDQGDLAAARALLERAVAINEKALGTNHPDTAAARKNLAILFQNHRQSR